MTKLLSILIAGFFATGVYAQAVTTNPGGAMGPTTKTEASKGGGSADKGAIKGDKAGPKSAEVVAPGSAMGPTTATEAAKGGASADKAKSTYKAAKDGEPSAVTTKPGGAMGPTTTTDAAKGGKK
ncbi:MAG: hypothetical protein ABI589_06845 [Burkholderiales bacterium]